MSDPQSTESDKGGEAFARRASNAASSMFQEYWYFLRHRKMWWMTPILLMVALLGLLVALSASGLAPFIYAIW